MDEDDNGKFRLERVKSVIRKWDADPILLKYVLCVNMCSVID